MTEKVNPWKRKESWTRRSGKFTVEVSHHTVDPSEFDYDEGVHRWAVYAYIYPNHRLFSRFEGESLHQDAAMELPLHRGCSHVRITRNDAGEICSYKVGADYHHLYDERFSHYEDQDDAYEVFADADRLFAQLED